MVVDICWSDLVLSFGLSLIMLLATSRMSYQGFRGAMMDHDLFSLLVVCGIVLSKILGQLGSYYESWRSLSFGIVF